MTTAILTLNAGSSSLKLGLFDGDRVLASGLVDRIGGDGVMRLNGANNALPQPTDADFSSHQAALTAALITLDAAFPGLTITAVGHRVVHGGPDFTAPAVVTPTVLAKLEGYAPFAPLHQSHNLAGIRAAITAFPQAVQVACFDTAFHRNQPWENDTYALPRSYYDKGVRRYGFHGLSYQFIAGELARTHPDLAAGRVIVAHLGNGASMCAMQGGRGIASTMGFSALDGLAMGTRVGQIDPGVLLYLMEQEGMGAAAISDLLYRQSGLLGLSGISNDMRGLEASDDPQAAQAIGYFCARIQREIGSLAAALGGLDALVFTGGIGENSARIRAQVCDGMRWIGIALDASQRDGVISTKDSPVIVIVIATNEEQVIARACALTIGTP